MAHEQKKAYGKENESPTQYSNKTKEERKKERKK